MNQSEPADTKQKSALALVAIGNRRRRSLVCDTLLDRGWAVMARRCGYDVVETIADSLLGDHACEPIPDLLVLDAMSSGVAGLSIERGLRALGLDSDIVLSSNAPAGSQPRLEDASKAAHTTVAAPSELLKKVEKIASSHGPAAVPAT